MMGCCSEKHNELVCRLFDLIRHEYILSVCTTQCSHVQYSVYGLPSISRWFPGAHQEVVTRELAEHWLVVRTDQENSGSVHSTGAGIDNLAGMVEQSGQCGL